MPEDWEGKEKWLKTSNGLMFSVWEVSSYNRTLMWCIRRTVQVSAQEVVTLSTNFEIWNPNTFLHCNDGRPFSAGALFSSSPISKAWLPRTCLCWNCPGCVRLTWWPASGSPGPTGELVYIFIPLIQMSLSCHMRHHW